jgi:two-component system, OmpR family, phosphate regulon response regulator PhoB
MLAPPPIPYAERILVIDDEPDLCELLLFNLREAGLAPEAASTAAQGLAAAERLEPAVIVLDVMLPDLPGTEVCRQIRAGSVNADAAILMLTARGDEADRVLGLEVGADDYVVKPFSVREVVLRVRALCRRAGERRAARGSADAGRRLTWKDLSIDPVRHRVYGGDVEIGLRPLEYKLISLLLEHPGRVYSRAELLQEVWGITAEINTRTVDTHVRRLREKLGAQGEVIETVHGFGYRLREG